MSSPDHLSLLNTLMHTGLSTAIRESTWAVMAMEAVHLIGLALLGGPALIVGLGGLRPQGLRRLSIPTLITALWPIALIGLGLMVLSGPLIALSMPFKYYENAAFRWKMLLLVLALVTTAALVRISRFEHQTPNQVAWQRGLSLTATALWIGVGFSGRLIGFL